VSVILRLRGLNFFYFSLFALFLSFLPVYGSRIGISGTHLGYIIGAGSVISMISQPLWGMVSDRYRTIRKVFLPLIAAGILFGTLLYRSESLWGYAALVALMYIFFLPTDPLMESLNYQTSQRHNVNFGSVRMFGAMGFAVASLSAGYVSDHWGMNSLSWVFLGCGLVTLLLVFTAADVQASSKPPAYGQLAAFMKQSHAWIFLLLVFVVATAHKMNDLFLGLYMEKLGAGMGMTGLAWFLMTAVEAVFFGLAARWIKPGREAAVMALAAGLYAVRFLLSAEITSPYAFAALQMMQGITFVLFYVSGIQYIHSISPEHWKSTGQTMFTVVFFGISGIIGSPLGGYILDTSGGSALYRVMAGIAALGCLLFLLILVPRSRRG
jgi:PPP family 3-phenylpropionic acid transporter